MYVENKDLSPDLEAKITYPNTSKKTHREGTIAFTSNGTSHTPLPKDFSLTDVSDVFTKSKYLLVGKSNYVFSGMEKTGVVCVYKDISHTKPFYVKFSIIDNPKGITDDGCFGHTIMSSTEDYKRFYIFAPFVGRRGKIKKTVIYRYVIDSNFKIRYENKIIIPHLDKYKSNDFNRICCLHHMGKDYFALARVGNEEAGSWVYIYNSKGKFLEVIDCDVEIDTIESHINEITLKSGEDKYTYTFSVSEKNVTLTEYI
jgi:hypothetical protein